MAKAFRYTLDRRVVNAVLTRLLSIGIAPRIYSLLTVAGRQTGRPYSLPVTIVEEGTQRWLVAPYGVVDWVKNARASGVISLSRGKVTSSYAIRELPPLEAAPVLKAYLRMFPITRPYFDVAPEASIDAFASEARTRPVFELTAPPTSDVAQPPIGAASASRGESGRHTL